MSLRRRLATLVAGITIAPLILLALPAGPASAHGWITSPPSRQDHCAKRRVDCGDIQYEPQSVEGPKGSRLCSGGSRFTVLDDESKPWPVTSISSTVTMQWKLTAAHRTSTWEYYVDNRLHQTFNQGNQQPPADISHTLTGLPGGRHKILAVWNITDTAMAFYACVDVQVGGGGGPPPPPPPPPPPCGPPWDASAIYLSGDQVSHNSAKWQAKWWTRGEEPGTTGEWGVWLRIGPC
jgi:predicted carbohydrate-binding protein with CBM5 and CBM33 domain